MLAAHVCLSCGCSRHGHARVRAVYGAESNDRVHKSFFYGSKHIDQYVPKVSANPRMGLTGIKAAEWAQQVPPKAPVNTNMYTTTALASSMAYKPNTGITNTPWDGKYADQVKLATLKHPISKPN